MLPKLADDLVSIGPQRPKKKPGTLDCFRAFRSWLARQILPRGEVTPLLLRPHSCGRFFNGEDMTHRYSDLLFSNSVKAAQELYGSRAQNTRFQSRLGPNDQLSQREVDFIARRDSFYLATVGETDWPYVQHRGGPPGFLRCLDGRRLAFPDFRGNGQLISTGNLSCNDRCSIILVDYPNRRRLKILGRMHMQDVRSAPTDIVGQLDLPGYRAIVERVALVDVSAYDWNCPQHITKRYTESEIETLLNEKITN